MNVVFATQGRAGGEGGGGGVAGPANVDHPGLPPSRTPGLRA